jgi:hypothetical protein
MVWAWHRIPRRTRDPRRMHMASGCLDRIFYGGGHVICGKIRETCFIEIHMPRDDDARGV